MDEPGCGEPCADKYGEQIHQLDGITVGDNKQKPGLHHKSLLGLPPQRTGSSALAPSASLTPEGMPRRWHKWARPELVGRSHQGY